MKRSLTPLTALLMAVAMMAAVCTASANEPVMEYKSDFFTFSFGGDAFEKMGNKRGNASFYTKPKANPLSGSYIVEEREISADIESMTDAEVAACYDLTLKEFVGNGEESANTESIEIEGKEARVFNYTLSAQGMPFPAAACVVMRGNRMLIVSYFEGRGESPEKIREKLKTAVETIQYLGQ